MKHPVALLLCVLFSSCAPCIMYHRTPPDAVQVSANDTLVPPDALDRDMHLDLRVHLSLRDEAALDERLRAMHDPASPLYGVKMTPAEFHMKHLPTQEHIDRVKKYLSGHGLQTTMVRGGILAVHGKVHEAEAAFETKLHTVKARPGFPTGQIAYSPLSDPHPNDSLGILAVRGLATHPPRRPHSIMHPRNATAAFTGPEIRKIYNVPKTSRGTGQKIGVVELDGYVAQDIYTYAEVNGFPRPNLINVLFSGYNGAPQSTGGQTEVTLDIELLVAMAPDAQQIRVYEAPNSDHAFIDILNEIASPTAGDKSVMDVVSISWGLPEQYLSSSSLRSEDVLFKQLAAEGISTYVAAGDSGAFDDGTDLGVDDPASQPWTIGVGGTRAAADANGVWVRESTWLNGGGGMSMNWQPQPWQSGLANAVNLGSAGHRLVPDVSLDADPATAHQIYVNGQWEVVGGTSAAAPLWTGFNAQVNAGRQSVKKKSLGFLAPHLYQVAHAEHAFHDIDDRSTNGYYPAVNGYDLATGLGTFDARFLQAALSGLP